MGTTLKYLFYIALIIIVYLVGKGIFEGRIDEKTTVGQVVDDVKSGAANMASDAADTAKEVVNEAGRRNTVRPAPVNDAEQGAFNSTEGEYKMTENSYNNGEPTTWEKTKEVSSDAWEATKDASGKAWDKTKEVSGNAWDKTKEVSEKAWDKTKEVSGNAWDKTKEGAKNLKDKVSDSADDAADAADDAADEIDDAAYRAQQRNSATENRADY